MPRNIELIFEVSCDETQWGELVVLVGNRRELGLWQVKQGVYLTASRSSYPRWRSSAISLKNVEENDDIEFKFVIAKKGEEERSARWEQTGECVRMWSG